MTTAPTVQDTATTAVGNSSFVNDINVSHTVASGVTNPMLIAVGTGFNQYFDSATWNGASMSRLAYGPGVPGNIFFLPNPSTGAHTLTTHSNTVDRGQMVSVFLLQDCGSIVMNSSDTTGFLVTTSATLTYTTTTDNSLLLGFAFSDNTTTQSQGTGQTQLSNVATAVNADNIRMTAFSKLGTTHGSQTLSITISSLQDLQIFGFAALPFSPFIPSVIII